MGIVSKIKNIALTAVNKAGLVSMESGHRYQKGMMHAKHIAAVAGFDIWMRDAELPGELKDRRSLRALWHKNIPYSPTYSKVRKENALSG
jgi:hypothetical protein